MKKTIFTSILLTSLISCGPSAEELAKIEKELSLEEKVLEQKEEKPEIWLYDESTDEMDGNKSFFASTNSTNFKEFDFPYNGGSTLELMVRNSETGNEIILTISKGQFMPSSYGMYESVKVKFDDEQSEEYVYNMAEDGSPEYAFLDNSKKFISKLKTAKKLKIEAPFFNEGRQVFEFEVNGLKWEH